MSCRTLGCTEQNHRLAEVQCNVRGLTDTADNAGSDNTDDCIRYTDLVVCVQRARSGYHLAVQ